MATLFVLPTLFATIDKKGAFLGNSQDEYAIVPIGALRLRLDVKDYYQARGWNVNSGVPTPAKLRELDLGYAIAK